MTDDAVSKLSSVCLFFVLFGFAPRQLGSTIYMIFTGKEPFGDLESVEVEARSSTAELPDASNLPFDGRDRLLTLSNKVLTIHLRRTRVEPEKHILPSLHLQRKRSDPLNPERRSLSL
jgi:hypothetical protein